MKIVSKDTLIDIALMAVATAIGVVVVAPFVAKLWAKLPFGRA